MDKLCAHDTWLVTVLSNSRENGAEFVLKCQDVCNRLGLLMQASDHSPDLTYDNMRMEVRITLVRDGLKRTGRIKVLAANPRTARGFSGDLILDEFAFHEDSHAIWEAAEPILASHPDYCCRIASTGNGCHNLFFRLSSGAGPDNGEIFISDAGFPVSRLSRTAAASLGVPIYDPHTRQPITPDAARAQALDKRAYDQNYECKFNHENMCLLTHELIQQAMREGLPIAAQTWSPALRERLQQATGELFLGQDVGRHHDLSVQVVLERQDHQLRVVAILRMAGLRLPDQQTQLATVCMLPKFRRACLDMTGLGLGLVEYAQKEPWGRTRIVGINFASTEPVNDFIRAEGRPAETARVTENMATALLKMFEDKTLTFEVALDREAMEDLRKPERITTPGGRTSIAAIRDGAGHADLFWALALAVRAAESRHVPVAYSRVTGLITQDNTGNLGLGPLTKKFIL
jgi:phage FluMu gp28-like protein